MDIDNKVSFPDLLGLSETDPEFVALFKQFAFQEVPKDLPFSLDERRYYLATLAVLVGSQGLEAYKEILPVALDNGVKAKEAFDKANHFGLGASNDAYAQYFIGQSYLNSLGSTKDGVIALHNVTFEPDCRNNWHIHHASKGGGQILICTAGEGWYQEEGKEAVSLSEGSVVIIPANVKHWHGAKKDSWFSHIAFGVPGEDLSNEWCEAVSDEEYNQLKD